jgi:hypothetical protein
MGHPEFQLFTTALLPFYATINGAWAVKIK